MIKYIYIFTFIMFANYGASQSPIFVDSLEDAIAISESSKQDILLVFSAEWCKNCEFLKKDFLLDNNDVINNMIICVINYDLNHNLVKEYKVKKIPDSRILRNNIEISRLIGYRSIEKYKNWINNARK